MTLYKYLEIFREGLMRDTLFRIFNEGLPIFDDDEEREEHKDTIYAYFIESLNKDVGGVKELIKKFRGSKTSKLGEIIEHIDYITETKKEKIVSGKEKIPEGGEDTVEIEIDDKDKENISDMNFVVDVDEISELIKQKVTGAIKIEKEKQEKADEEKERMSAAIKEAFIHKGDDFVNSTITTNINNDKDRYLGEHTVFSTIFDNLLEEYTIETDKQKKDELNIDDVYTNAIVDYSLLEFYNTLNMKYIDKDKVIAKNLDKLSMTILKNSKKDI